jgi:hypothetical protein
VSHDDCEQAMPLHLTMVTLHDFCLVSVSMAFDEVMWLITEWKEKRNIFCDYLYIFYFEGL